MALKVLEEQPVSNIKWIKVEDIAPNNYNPNICIGTELKGLRNSLLNNGWVFPITVNNEGYIIDGFHRYYLSVNDKEVRKKYKGFVPVAIMDIDTTEAMCMTVAMNNAKGTHQSSLMHNLISDLFNEKGLSKEEIAKKCVLSIEEVDVLLRENVFKKLDIENHQYSKGWIPKKNVEK